MFKQKNLYDLPPKHLMPPYLFPHVVYNTYFPRSVLLGLRWESVFLTPEYYSHIDIFFTYTNNGFEGIECSQTCGCCLLTIK